MTDEIWSTHENAGYIGENYWSLFDGSVVVALKDNVTIDVLGGATFAKAGVYFSNIGWSYVQSFTSPTTETIQPMAEEFMPMLTSPNGTKYQLTVSDDGTLSAVAVS